MDTLIGAMKSKTVWFNIFSLMASAGGMMAGVLTPETIAALVALGNIGLRFLTTTSLSDK